MTKRIRYLLIAVGFAVFAILAPLIVMYVRGLSFNFAEKKFVQTGILAIWTDPKQTDIFIYGKLARKSSGDIKFLLPGEYDVALRKDGYFDWSKRLTVQPGQVTWASPALNKIFLFFNPPKLSVIADQVTDYYKNPGNDTVYFLSKNNLTVGSTKNPDSSSNIALPKPATQLAASGDGKQLLLLGTTSSTPVVLYFNTGSQKLQDLSLFFTNPCQWQFSDNGSLYALNGGQLYLVDAQNQTKKLLQKNIKSFTFVNGNIYLLKQKDTTLSLEAGSDPAGENQEILKNLPLFNQATVMVSFEKQVFVLADGTLYKAAAALEPLAYNVSDYHFDNEGSSVVFFHQGQLDYYNPFKNALDFITRRGNALLNPLLRQDLDYVFFIENNQVKALELDARDRQNEFGLYNGTDIKKFSLDSDGKILLVLDGEELKTVVIR